MLKSLTDSCPVWRPSSQHCPLGMAGTWSSSLDSYWTPRAHFKTLPRENFSLHLSGASRGPLNLVSDSAPFPYVRQN